MKINLYYAPYPSQIFEGETEPINTERPHNPKSALTTIAAGLRAYAPEFGYNCDVEIIDLQLGGQRVPYKSFEYGPRIMNCYRYGTPFEDVEEKMRTADVHGLTCNFTNSAQVVADLAQHIRRVNPNAVIVAGGVDCTARPEYYLARGVDIVVRGEGERVFAMVISALYKKQDVSAIPNIASREFGHAKKVDLSAIIDMNTIEPMALDLVPDLSVYNDTAEGPPPEGVQGNYICWETSRGCAWRCSFCTAPSRGGYRYMSLPTIEKHLRMFQEYDIKTIVWQEDNPLSRIQQNGTGKFLYDSGRAELMDMFRMFRDYGFSWEFANGIEFGKFMQNGKFDHHLADALLGSEIVDGRWTGCYRVQIPLDNMNVKKRRFPKLLGFDDQIDVLATMLTDHGVAHQTYDLFIGYPEHDHEGVDIFAEYCMRLKEELTSVGQGKYKPYFNVFNLSLLPGARDYQTLRHLLAFDIEQHPEVIGIFLSAINTDHFSYWDIYQKRLEMTTMLNDRETHRIYDGIYAG
jgi:hopanoid C-3 methylase